ncbi:DUF3822 family protein [Porphyromonas levii]|uniref:DUF3822 family protein n=1 Tax=Porphyromonas levii TaxID=28114 RepID=UPI001B8BF459|nr:hypothetical protein [Porphyromonas levii]MBR8802634.1 hypothetical protein [Porphyromonas levii]
MGNIITIDPKREASYSADKALNMEAYLVVSRGQIQYAARPIDDNSTIYTATAQLVNHPDGGMQQLFWEYPLFALPYKSTVISVEDSSSFVVVPQDLLGSASKEEWLGVATGLSGRRVMSIDMEEERSTVIYSISQELFDFSQRSFSIPSYTHCIVPLIRLAVTFTRRDVPRVVILMHLGESINVVIATEGRLLLANRYKVASDIDTLYYVTALYRQFKFSPQDTPLLVYSLEGRGKLLSLLGDIISDVRWNSYPYLSKEYQQNKVLTTIHQQLVLQLLCV